MADQNLGLRFNDASKCFIYPQYVDPAIAQQGQPVYPVDIIADFGANSMKAGESYLLIVTTTMIDNFPQSPQWKAYMAFDKVTDLQFTMNASNFEYSPSNENVQGVPFGYNLPAVYTWSIAPLERASGEQSLIVRAVGEEASIDFGAIIVIDVRDKLGLKPSTLASVTTISFVFAYFLSQTKIFIEIMDSLGKLNVKKKK